MTERVVQILKNLPSCALQLEMSEPPEYHLQCLCFYMFTVCHTISSKYRLKTSQRGGDRKSRRRAAVKALGDSRNVNDSPTLSPEVELAERVTADPPSILQDFQCTDVPAFVQLLKNHGLDSFSSLCHLFAEKLDLLRQYFTWFAYSQDKKSEMWNWPICYDARSQFLRTPYHTYMNRLHSNRRIGSNIIHSLKICQASLFNFSILLRVRRLSSCSPCLFVSFSDWFLVSGLNICSV